ncbi:Signal recognition particle 9 kDa protein [Trichoplax sp. H2]|uniref:Signal recognition particle 9 kDa protein n=1 Tax=Trichoplax adhaerens TaxID=10228 RepID=B3SAJ3_TRIAD|nr:expressed hypothetical protein [Trichoplax adhaerens]EDV20271.1 expressed hypothetical protein [Trichoplax adhaerens]RDD42553.1 Signal recognition particle 9 kDa protein [Trichoplax sp. H2]|eukprot:XP_002117221.1 expressed hypothetical protein [Trichoplax adhaerens]
MTYLDTWEEFAAASESLYQSDAVNFRFVWKYRHSDGKLIAKATNNKVCLKYRTDQIQDVKKLEKLSSTLMRLMVSK